MAFERKLYVLRKRANTEIRTAGVDNFWYSASLSCRTVIYKGMLIADYGNYKLLPEKDFKGFTPPKKTIADSVGHHKEWVEACKSGGTTTCNFDYSGALAETVLLGNVAYRAGGGKLQYDAKTGRVTGNNNAEQYLKREYRRGWTL